jgi:hypothetical protein
LDYIRKQAADPRSTVPANFTIDGNWLVYHNLDENGKDRLFRAPATGGAPEVLGDYPTSSPNSYLQTSRDGRQFLVNAPASAADGVGALVIQNFIPAAARK